MFFENMIGLKLISDAFSAIFGTWICFSPLNWKKGLITVMAVYWGLFLGLTMGIVLSTSTDNPSILLVAAAIGPIILPILVYKVAAINRFIIGFIVAMKITFMITTVMMKEGEISVLTAIMIPLAIGALVGFVLMLWTQFSIGAYIIAISFIGASQAAPSISNIINYFEAGLTGDIWWDEYDILFALLKIELTDFWTLIILVIFMIISGILAYKRITSVIPPTTPIIVYDKQRKRKK